MDTILMSPTEQDEFDKRAAADFAQWQAMRREHAQAKAAVDKAAVDIKLVEMDRDAARLEIRDLREQLRESSNKTAEAVAERVKAETLLHNIRLICTQGVEPQKQLMAPRVDPDASLGAVEAALTNGAAPES